MSGERLAVAEHVVGHILAELGGEDYALQLGTAVEASLYQLHALALEDHLGKIVDAAESRTLNFLDRSGDGDLGDGGGAERLVSYLLQGGRQLDAADGGILKGAGMDYGDGIFDAGNLDMLGDDDILAREVGCGQGHGWLPPTLLDLLLMI